MNIAMFSDTYEPQVNGVVTMLKMLERELTSLGHNVYVVTVDHPKADPKDNVYRTYSLRFPQEKQHRIGLPFDYKEIISHMNKWKIDLIHTHSLVVLGYTGNIVAKYFKIPNVTTYHTLMVEYAHYVPVITGIIRKFLKSESKNFCNRNRAVIAPSIKTKNILRSYGVTVPIEVIPNGIDIEKVQHKFTDEEKKNFKLRFGIKENDKVLIFVGRLGQEKSIDVLFENISKLVKNTDKNIKFLLVGDGPLKEKLIRLTKKLRIEDNVIFTGYLDWPKEISLAYQCSDMFIMASKTETFGLVTLEAICNGLPVVAFDDPCIYGMVEHGVNGYLNPDDKLLHENILEIIDNPQRCEKMSEKSLEMCQAFTGRQNALKTIDLYERVLKDEI